MRKFIHRRLGLVLYLVMFFFGAYVLWYGYGQHLFAPPAPGMDQHTILNCALELARGKLPAGRMVRGQGIKARGSGVRRARGR